MATAIKFSMNDFFQYAHYVKNEIGLNLKEDKVGLLEGRLQKMMLERNLTPATYLKLVQANPLEKSLFIDAVTTHKTDWFRENIHFDFILRLAQETNDKKFLFWSAASSTGEESYSLSMRLQEGSIARNRFKILGTDISEMCIQHCAAGAYRKEVVVSQVSPVLIKKYFVMPKVGESQKMIQLNSEYFDNLKFRKLNLLTAKFPVDIRFDVILLRNVMIYFDQETIKKVILNLLNYLRPNGFLIIGLSETIHNSIELKLERVSNSIYQYVPK